MKSVAGLVSRNRVLALAMAVMMSGVVARAEETVTVRGPVVVAGHAIAAQAGLDVLKAGGNAADALVAVSMTLGVVEPGMSGMGGKLLVMYYDAKTKRVSFMAALNPAPLKIDVKEVAGAAGVTHEKGWTAACVPAMPAGLGAVHGRFGSKPWKDLIEPVAKLADEGFELTAKDADMWEEFPTAIDPAAAAIYAPGGKQAVKGQKLKNPDLAKTMRVVANKGWKAFYEGEIPAKFEASAKKAGWPMTVADFAAYKVRWSEPVEFTYKGNRVLTSPPPLTGGTTVMATMKVLEGWDWGTEKPKSSRDPVFVDAFSRAMLTVSGAVNRTAGDAPESAKKVKESFEPADVKKLMETAKAMKLKETTGGGDTTGMTAPPSEGFMTVAGIEGNGEILGDETERGCTTPLIIQDAMGNVIVATQSLGLHFGSGVVAEGTGVLLNSDMSNFAFKSPTSMNMVAGGKWPRSTIAPTLVLDKNGRPVVAASGAGGARIPPAVGQVLLDVLDFNQEPLAAVKHARFNMRRGKDGAVVDVEGGMSPEVEAYLKTQGWSVDLRGAGGLYFASVQVMKFGKDGKVTAAADKRRSSDAKGANIPD